MSIITQTIIYITYLGTACFQIDANDCRLLTDPGDFFTNRLSEEKARSLSNVDIILVTHADFDHVNRLALVPKVNDPAIIGTESVRSSFPSLGVFTGAIYEKKGVSIKRVKSIHGVRHDVDHSSYLITIGGVRMLFLGDAYKVIDKVEEPVDLMFVTISGFEATPENAVKLAAEIRPKVVIPMHWEVLFRTTEPAQRLAKLLAISQPDVLCFIPDISGRFAVKKNKELIIGKE